MFADSFKDGSCCPIVTFLCSIVAVLPLWVMLEAVDTHRVEKHMVINKAEVADTSGFMYAGPAIDAGCNNSLRTNTE
jgi:hypothetical protein